MKKLSFCLTSAKQGEVVLFSPVRDNTMYFRAGRSYRPGASIFYFYYRTSRNLPHSVQLSPRGFLAYKYCILISSV